MKGFIEVTDTLSGTVLINAANIVCVKPLIGVSIGSKPANASLSVQSWDKEVQTIKVAEKYAQIKALISEAF